jgi:hypothetical protein
MPEEHSMWYVTNTPRFLLGSVLLIVGTSLVVPFTQPVFPLVRQEMYGEFEPLYAAFGPCGTPCHITYSEGGHIKVFEQAAELAKRTGLHSIIDGRCISACSIYADFARPLVCVTPLATLEFHKATGWGEYVDPPQSADIRTWVESHGGYQPVNLLVMPYLDALQFWPSCPSPKSL